MKETKEGVYTILEPESKEDVNQLDSMVATSLSEFTDIDDIWRASALYLASSTESSSPGNKLLQELVDRLAPEIIKKISRLEWMKGNGTNKW